MTCNCIGGWPPETANSPVLVAAVEPLDAMVVNPVKKRRSVISGSAQVVVIGIENEPVPLTPVAATFKVCAPVATPPVTHDTE